MKALVSYGVAARLSKAGALVLALAGSAAAAETDILALGDSLTQGYGLLDGEGLVPRLRDWLEAEGHDVRIVNGGVSGDTTAGGLSRVEWSLTPEIDAMIVALGGNDLLRGIDPAVSRANLDGILDVADARDLPVLLIGMPAPGNYGPEYKQAFDAIYPELAEAHGALLYPDFFAGLREDGDMPDDMVELMQADGIHPSAEGVKRIVEDLGPVVVTLIDRAGD